MEGGREIAWRVHEPEDIMICVDSDVEVDSPMMVAKGGERSYSRLDVLKQALLLFVHSKVLLHPQHRFAFSRLDSSIAMHEQEFTNNTDVLNNSIRALRSCGKFNHCNLSKLFRLFHDRAKKSQENGRIFRVILIYCRSSVVPSFKYEMPEGGKKFFTFDVLYLHEKMAANNCPQEVYDALVTILEVVSEYEGYIFESGVGIPRTLYKHMCILLSHPQNRCNQDNIEVPKALEKRSASGDFVGGSSAGRWTSEGNHSHY